MALQPGTVSVTPAGVLSGSGLALAIASALGATLPPEVASMPDAGKYKQGHVEIANVIAQQVCAEFIANAEVQGVETDLSGDVYIPLISGVMPGGGTVQPPMGQFQQSARGTQDNSGRIL